MDAKTQVLETMKKEGIPLNAGKIVELTNPDRKVVDKAMTELKADETSMVYQTQNRMFRPKDVTGRQIKVVF